VEVHIWVARFRVIPGSKVAYLWEFGFFVLCSPDCPKQPRIENLIYRLLYPMLCGVSCLMGQASKPHPL